MILFLFTIATKAGNEVIKSEQFSPADVLFFLFFLSFLALLFLSFCLSFFFFEGVERPRATQRATCPVSQVVYLRNIINCNPLSLASLNVKRFVAVWLTPPPAGSWWNCSLKTRLNPFCWGFPLSEQKKSRKKNEKKNSLGNAKITLKVTFSGWQILLKLGQSQE